jgi:phosphatidylserine/phosphatidylglycerophosphate/cardiolipin synthase-like enzyme
LLVIILPNENGYKRRKRMLRLLREHEVAAKFRKERERANEAVVAVPFWGKGAASTLGFSQGIPVRVLCNLAQPGCNPDAIDEVRKLGIKVRSHARLHAKIYATGHVAIVGSSNVSTNGLTEEGAAARSWIEANVVSDDPTFVAGVLALFEKIWDDPETKPVRKSDIEAARKARLNWPAPIAALGKKTLFAACRDHPDDFGLSMWLLTLRVSVSTGSDC